MRSQTSSLGAHGSALNQSRCEVLPRGQQEHTSRLGGLLPMHMWRLQGKQKKANQIDQGEISYMHNDYRPVMEHTIGKAAELSLFASCRLLDVSAYKA
jgi:hypothetical protein